MLCNFILLLITEWNLLCWVLFDVICRIFDARSIFQKGLSVCVSVTLPLQFCIMAAKNTSEKVHIVSAREISIFFVRRKGGGVIGVPETAKPQKIFLETAKQQKISFKTAKPQKISFKTAKPQKIFLETAKPQKNIPKSRESRRRMSYSYR